LFRRAKYETDEIYQSQLHRHIHNLHHTSFEKNLFILQYPTDCGVICHDLLTTKSQDLTFNYEIINFDHALVRIDLSTLQILVHELSNIILDYIPLLPQLKIDEDLILDVVCLNQSTIMNLHMIFMPLADDDLLDLLTLIKFHPELFPSNYTLPLSTQDLLPTNPLSHRSVHTLLIPLLCQYGEIGLTLFSTLSSIQWIELRPQMTSSSYWANGVTQSGQPLVNILHEANLTGDGQVIGIADTGIDINSCYFYDPNEQFVFNELNPKHRKILYYNSMNGNTLDDSGHGTLVAGTSSGNCFQSTSSSSSSHFNGIAPNSKIAFLDISLADGSLHLPSNLYSNLFLQLYQISNSKIQSMSWGSLSNKYTNDARDVDIFMWDYPDSLIFIAAGNDGNTPGTGTDGIIGEGTVGTPATNKNGLAVGASLNSVDSFKSYDLISYTTDGEYDDRSLASFSSRGPTKDGRMKPDVCGVGRTSLLLYLF
jgi:hypothetical protein